MRAFSIIILIIFFSCVSEKRNANEILLEIDADNEYFVNHRNVSEQELKNVLLDEKQKIMRAGIDAEQIDVFIKIDPLAKIGPVATLQTVLRQLNFKKITYIDTSKTKSI